MTFFRTIATVLMPMLLLVLGAGAAVAQTEYRVRPGDTLVVEVLEDASLNRAVTVLPDGRISFPFAGTLAVAGRNVGEIQTAIATGISVNFAARPNVFVAVQPGERSASVATPATINIFFVGEVNEPGVKALPRGTTLLQALATSGGLTRFAADQRIQLRRTDRSSGAQSMTRVDYRALANGAAMNDFMLADGDVILVPERRLFE